MNRVWGKSLSFAERFKYKGSLTWRLANEKVMHFYYFRVAWQAKNIDYVAFYDEFEGIIENIA
jgi:hypothetical protein